MGERPEFLSKQPEDQVLAGDGEPRDGVTGWVAEDEESSRVRGRGRQQPLVVGVAADDAVEHDHVGRVEAIAVDRDVVEPPLRSVLESGLAEELSGFLVVGRRELEVDGSGRAALEQLDLDLPDAAADLEHARTLDPALLEELDHAPGGLAEAMLPVTPRDAAGEAGAEKPVAAARVAAAGHPRSLSAVFSTSCLRKLAAEVCRPGSIYALVMEAGFPDLEKEFEQYTQDALDSLPSDLRARMSNVEIVVEDEPPPGQRLLGLYQGVPLTQRGSNYSGVLPDKITIYRRPLIRVFGRDSDRLRREVRRVVLHEVAHHFGISDERLIEIDRY